MSLQKGSQAGEDGTFKPINVAQTQNLPGCVLRGFTCVLPRITR